MKKLVLTLILFNSLKLFSSEISQITFHNDENAQTLLGQDSLLRETPKFVRKFIIYFEDSQAKEEFLKLSCEFETFKKTLLPSDLSNDNNDMLCFATNKPQFEEQQK